MAIPLLELLPATTSISSGHFAAWLSPSVSGWPNLNEWHVTEGWPSQTCVVLQLHVPGCNVQSGELRSTLLDRSCHCRQSVGRAHSPTLLFPPPGPLSLTWPGEVYVNLLECLHMSSSKYLPTTFWPSPFTFYFCVYLTCLWSILLVF